MHAAGRGGSRKESWCMLQAGVGQGVLVHAAGRGGSRLGPGSEGGLNVAGWASARVRVRVRVRATARAYSSQVSERVGRGRQFGLQKRCGPLHSCRLTYNHLCVSLPLV